MAETFDPRVVWRRSGRSQLITLKGYRLLQQAQVVSYTGSLMADQHRATGLSATGGGHDSAAPHLEQILDLMEAGVKAEKRWCGLQTGDVSLWLGARAGRRADPPRIRWQVVPGVSFPRRGGGAGVEHGTRSRRV